MGKAAHWNKTPVIALAILLVFALLPVSAFAAEVTWEEAYQATGDSLENQSHTVGAEWVVIGLSRSGRNISDNYFDLLAADIASNADENHGLHSSKASVNARMILTLTAMGRNAADVDGIDLAAGLGSMDYVKKQGLSGVIWALIALDSGNYAASGDVSREALIEIILSVECANGGWAISGSFADPDMTGMALQALAPYYDANPDVKAAADRAVGELSKMQRDDGGFATVGTATSESIAQVIVALTALGIDPDTDARFIKNGSSAVDALLAYYVEGGGFRHIMADERNPVATEQGYYALTAYARFLEGKNRLYDMTDVLDMGGDAQKPAQPEPTEQAESIPTVTGPAPAEEREESSPWWPVAGIAVIAAALIALYGKRKK